MNTRIAGAKAILSDDIIETDITLSDGTIAEIGGSSTSDQVIDGRGLLLAPAMVDIHGDAFERQMMPRPGVFFPIDAAMLETDRQLACNGIATAYHALTLSWEPGLRSVERGTAFVDGFEALQSRFTIENRIQLRWETFAFEAVDLIERVLQSPLTPSVAFNDHTSMTMRAEGLPVQQRLFEHNPDFAVADTRHPDFLKRLNRTAERAGMSIEDYRAMLLRIWERRADVPAMIEKVAAMGRTKSASMLSHDDTQLETRDFFRNHGAHISEFPMSKPVAQAARNNGDAIVFGAPNVLRGGSHIGSPSAADMVEDGLCDVLASDYFYPAMLAAIARLDREKRGERHALWSLVSGGPAKACKLDDRGEIAVGKRADLILIDWPQGETPAVKMTMSGGKIAYRAQ